MTRTHGLSAGIAAIPLLVLMGCSASPPAAGGPKGEQLLFPPPPGFVEVYRTRSGNLDHSEMVPKGQSVTNWTEMVTTQIFRGGVEQKTPTAFAEWLSAQWKQACPRSATRVQHTGEVLGGYPFALWMMTCEESPSSGGSEYTTAMAIGGRDSFYVVQKAWRPAPDQAEIKKWNKEFFSFVHVCDDRSEASPCPAEGDTIEPPREN